MPTLSPAQFAAAGGKTTTQGSNYSAYQNFVQNNVQGAVKLPTQSPGLLSSLNSLIQPGGAINNFAAGIGTGLEESPVTSATRVAQAGVAATELPKQMQQIAQENESTAKVQTLIDQMNATTDPAQKVALANQAKQLLVSSSTPDKSSASTALNNLNNPISTLGVTVQPQQGGIRGAEQAAGNFAEGIGEAAGGELPGTVGATEGLVPRLVAGVIGGGTAGGLMSGGSALQKPNATASSVAGATGGGVLGGGLLGAGGVLAPEIAGDLADNIKESVNKAPETSTVPDTLTSRTADVTPDYHKSMVRDNVVNPQGEYVPRVNEGEGTFGKRTVTTSKAEAQVGEEVNKLPNYPDKGTALQKSQAVYKAIQDKGSNLTESLKAEDTSAPLNKEEANRVITKVVYDNIDTEASPSSTVGKYQNAVLKELQNYDNTRNGINELRKNLEDTYQQYRGKAAYGTDSRNAIDDVNKGIRDGLNKELAESTASTDVKASLGSQSKLFRAKDVLDDKAENEATSKFGAYLKSHPMIAKVGTRGLMRIAIEVTGVALAASTINTLYKNILKNK